MKFHINSFVKRQTSESRFSNYCGTWEMLRDEVEQAFKMGRFRQGYREGVLLVSMPVPEAFLSGVVELVEGDVLVGSYEARREGETPRKSVQVSRNNGKKMPAKSADVVLYASTVLAEDDSNELPAREGNWEVISINANPCLGPMPISPMVLMHNHFGSDGGTATHMTDSEFVEQLRESFEFWKSKAMIASND